MLRPACSPSSQRVKRFQIFPEAAEWRNGPIPISAAMMSTAAMTTCADMPSAAAKMLGD